jgi:transglutaminase-like putative cysteine protease
VAVKAIRALDTVSILAATLLFALVTRRFALPLTAIPAVVSLLALTTREGVRADAFAQIATSLSFGAGAGYVTASLRNPSEIIPPGVLDTIPNVAAMAMLGATCVRPWFAVGRGSGLATSGLLSLSLVTLGQGQRDLRYAGLCLLAVTLSFAARALERSPEKPTGPSRAREAAAVLALLAIAVGGTLVGRLALPALYRWSSRRMVHAYARGQSVSGLSDHLALEAMDGILQSDTVVLRVRGARTDYLRGAVFDRYRVGAWSFRREAERRPLTVPRRARGLAPGEVEIRRVSGPPGWVLTPLDARELRTTDGELEALPSGVLRSPRESSTVWFRPEGPRQVPIDPPGPFDSEVTPTHRRFLARWLEAWGCATGALAARLGCIERTLRARYRYDLTVPEPGGDEPLMSFLEVHRRGHCEYFASAMTLLARAAGAPARVVAGYRVTERSEWGDFHIVRERNAHTWTEVYLPSSGWTRWDATPASADELMARRPVPRWRTFLDAVRWRVVDAVDRVRAGGALVWAGAALALVLGGSVLRRNLRERWRTAKDPRDGPTPGMRALLDALARADVGIARGESLERYAARLGEARRPLEKSTEIQLFIERYVAARYGPAQDADLEATLHALARRVDADRR